MGGGGREAGGERGGGGRLGGVEGAGGVRVFKDVRWRGGGGGEEVGG